MIRRGGAHGTRINHQKRNNQRELDVHGQCECRPQDVFSLSEPEPWDISYSLWIPSTLSYRTSTQSPMNHDGRCIHLPYESHLNGVHFVRRPALRIHHLMNCMMHWKGFVIRVFGNCPRFFLILSDLFSFHSRPVVRLLRSLSRIPRGFAGGIEQSGIVRFHQRNHTSQWFTRCSFPMES
jgi:hypothetical protein